MKIESKRSPDGFDKRKGGIKDVSRFWAEIIGRLCDLDRSFHVVSYRNSSWTWFAIFLVYRFKCLNIIDGRNNNHISLEFVFI